MCLIPISDQFIKVCNTPTPSPVHSCFGGSINWYPETPGEAVLTSWYIIQCDFFLQLIRLMQHLRVSDPNQASHQAFLMCDKLESWSSNLLCYWNDSDYCNFPQPGRLASFCNMKQNSLILVISIYFFPKILILCVKSAICLNYGMHSLSECFADGHSMLGNDDYYYSLWEIMLNLCTSIVETARIRFAAFTQSSVENMSRSSIVKDSS